MYRKAKKSSAKMYFTVIVLIFTGVMIFANKWVESTLNKLLYRAIVSSKITALERKDEENRRRIYK